MRNTVGLILFVILSFELSAQFASNMTPEQRTAWQVSRDSINRITQYDHQNMLDQLMIKTLRKGANGRDTEDAFYANYDESISNPYPNLPQVLITNGRQKVDSPEMWWNIRRYEIAEMTDREVYGRTPLNTPGVEWVVLKTEAETIGSFQVITKTLEGRVDNSSYPAFSVNIRMKLFVLANRISQNVPVVLEFGYGFNRANNSDEITWQQQVLTKGWAYATLLPTSVQADNGAGLTQGIIGLMNKGRHRKPDDWGALKAWGWAATKALNYFETNPDVDAKRVAIEGYSRYGKAAAVAMAYDVRFACGFISSSGEGGLKIHRRNYGELVENVAGSSEYHWMAGNFIKYAGPLSWDDLPVDAHELVALIAPRPVFISSGEKGDAWVDARGMFMAGAAASPVHELLGKCLGTEVFPPV